MVFVAESEHVLAQSPEEHPLRLPLWFFSLCRWFWGTQGHVWRLAFNLLISPVLWIVGVLLVTANPQTLPLHGLINHFARNGVTYTLVLFILFLILLSFTCISYLVAHPEMVQPQILQEEQRAQAQKLTARDDLRVYLRWLQDDVGSLTCLGLAVDVNTKIPLQDVSIPMEFHASPKALKASPLHSEELEHLDGLDAQHKDYLLTDPRSDWERNLRHGRRLTIENLWQSFSREQPTVVLQGDAGSGKSTVLARFSLSLALVGQGLIDERFSLHSSLIPILVSIREYADYLEQLPAWQSDRSVRTFLLWSLEQKLERKGVARAREIASQVAIWLGECRCLVMFDGLDEVSNSTRQREIQQAIHDFIEQQRRPHLQTTTWNRFFITTRFAEYEAPDLKNYPSFLIAELSREQVANYLPCWYAVNNRERALEAEYTAKLLRAYDLNETVRKLAGYPLLLTLMAAMIANGIPLPERRIELYQAVARTLLESQNEQKGLPVLNENEAIQRLGPLAWKMQEKGNTLIKRSEVQKEISAALAISFSSGSSTQQTLEQEAENYLSLLAKRGGLFLQRTGEYYSFLHRSFQDYFVARHLLRKIDDESERVITATVRLVRGNPRTWREPFILAVACKSDGDGGPLATRMLRMLLKTRGKDSLQMTLLVVACISESR